MSLKISLSLIILLKFFFSPVSGMLLDDHDSSPIIIDDADEDDVETFRTDIGRSSNRSTRSSTFNGIYQKEFDILLLELVI